MIYQIFAFHYCGSSYTQKNLLNNTFSYPQHLGTSRRCLAFNPVPSRRCRMDLFGRLNLLNGCVTCRNVFCIMCICESLHDVPAGKIEWEAESVDSGFGTVVATLFWKKSLNVWKLNGAATIQKFTTIIQALFLKLCHILGQADMMKYFLARFSGWNIADL